MKRIAALAVILLFAFALSAVPVGANHKARVASCGTAAKAEASCGKSKSKGKAATCGVSRKVKARAKSCGGG